MRKRAGLARAIALDPDMLFFDEPSAGLDPLSSLRLDELILELRDSLGATVVMVTHELPSIFAIADNSVFLTPRPRLRLHGVIRANWPRIAPTKKYATSRPVDTTAQIRRARRSSLRGDVDGKAEQCKDRSCTRRWRAVLINCSGGDIRRWCAISSYARIAVAYFDGSVAGLSVGATVTYRGVPVGSVSKIVLEVSAQTGESRIPVYLQFQPGEITYTDGHELTQAAFEGAIRDGLRAQLVSQSFITGQLAVQLDYFPGTPIVLAGPKTSMIEIPTVPSTFQEIRERLSNLPLQNIAEAALGTLKSLDTLLQSPDTHAMLQDLSATIHQAQSLLETVRPQLTGVLKQADAALAAGERTADQLTDTVKLCSRKLTRR